jgi:hypothetical protein
MAGNSCNFPRISTLCPPTAAAYGTEVRLIGCEHPRNGRLGCLRLHAIDINMLSRRNLQDSDAFDRHPGQKVVICLYIRELRFLQRA